MADNVASASSNRNSAVTKGVVANDLRYFADEERFDEVPDSDPPKLCMFRRNPRGRLDALGQRLASARPAAARPTLAFSNPVVALPAKRDRVLSNAPLAEGPPPTKASANPSPKPRATEIAEPRFEALTLSEVEKLEPLDWLVDGVLLGGPKGKLIDLRGRPGAGKSKLAREWALSIALGRVWEGQAVKQGPVIFVHTEGIDEVGGWVAAWAQREGILQADLEVTPIRFIPDAVNMLDEKEVKAFIAEMRAIFPSPALIVLDTRANCLPGEENGQAEMAAFIMSCRKIMRAFRGCTMLVLTHPGKDVKKGTAGSAKWIGALDGSLNLTELNANGGETTRLMIQGAGPRTLQIEKIRGRGPLPPIQLEMNGDGLFARAADGAPVLSNTRRGRPRGEQEIIVVLRERSMNYTELYEAVKDRLGGRLSTSTFKTRLKELEKAGLVAAKGGLYSVLKSPETLEEGLGAIRAGSPIESPAAPTIAPDLGRGEDGRKRPQSP